MELSLFSAKHSLLNPSGISNTGLSDASGYRENTMKVLVVDDSPAVRRAVRMLLERNDSFEVCGEAENGREAIEKTAELRPELIIIDLSMPVLNGLDAVRGIRRIKPEVPIILFSTFSDVLMQEEAHSAGISALVSKAEPGKLVNIALILAGRNAA